MSAPRFMQLWLTTLKTSGSDDDAKLCTATDSSAVVETQAKSVPPFVMNSPVIPRSFMPRQ